MREKTNYEDDAREALAAAAMAFAPATDVPREQALIRSAIISILLDFGDKEFTLKEGVQAISRHGALPELRMELARSLFDKLLSENVIRAGNNVGANNFQLGEEFAKKTFEEADKINQMVDRVISDLFDTGSMPPQIMPKLRKELLATLAQVMKLYGEQYAYQIAGRTEKPVVVQRKELVKICEQTITTDMKGHVSPAKMADAITELFEQRERHFAAFVFSLAQNYYYLRLMGLAGGLEFLAEDRFSGSEFLLDTNVLFPLLIEQSRHRRSIMELVSVTQQLRISLHETEITLDEFRKVIDYQRTTLPKVFDEVPDDLVAVTNNVFLQDYRKNKQQNPSLTIEAYFAQFHDVREKLEKQWGVTVFDDPVEKKITAAELDHTKKVINECSEQTRPTHTKKSAGSLEHDAHVYYVVLAERERYGDKTAWLLTLDTSLPHVARKLQGTEAVPFCMSLDGFLQIISPYARADHEQSFAEVFVELVGNNLFPPEEVINIEDFRMFTDFDLSVRYLPGADVKKVIRRVKDSLNGTLPFDTERHRVAYEVQKALCDPTLKYRTELEEKIKRHEDEIKELEKSRDMDSESHKLQLQKIETENQMKFEEFYRKFQELADKSSGYEQEIKSLIKKHQRAWFIVKALVGFAVLATLLKVCWWLIDTRVYMAPNSMLCKFAVSLAFIAVWIGIVVPKTWMRIISFVLAALAVFFSAWKVLGK